MAMLAFLYSLIQNILNVIKFVLESIQLVTIFTLELEVIQKY